MNINELLDKAQSLKIKKKLKENELVIIQNTITLFQIELENCQKARIIVQEVANKTQEKIEFQISNLVSLALSAVFPDPYEFKVKFVQRRNRTECDLLFVKNNEEVEPLSAAGGGAVDIASFALRVAIWSIKKTRPVFIFDEPGKFLSRDLQNKFSALIKELSYRLQVQFIIVSHIPEIQSCSDRVFSCVNKNGISFVESVDSL